MAELAVGGGGHSGEGEVAQMRGVVLLGDGELEVRSFPDPEPGYGEVLVQMKASGICGSDLWPLRMSRSERGDPAKLNISGHEPCGVVAELGEGVAEVAVGKRVIVHHYSGCGRCKYCRIGYPQLCVHGHKVYGFTADGGHADFMVVPAHMCLDLPQGMSFEEGAAIACGTGTAYAALRRLAVSGRDTLVVFGQGPVGLSATLLGSAMGARVIAIDLVPYRLKLAKRLGAAEAFNASDGDPVEAVRDLTKGEGAEATMDCTGVPEVRVQAIESAKVFGRTCLVGEHGGMALQDVSRQVIHKHLTVYGSWTFSTALLEEAANWVVESGIPLKRLITHRFSIGEAGEAFGVFQSGETGKVVFVWP